MLSCFLCKQLIRLSDTSEIYKIQLFKKNYSVYSKTAYFCIGKGILNQSDNTIIVSIMSLTAKNINNTVTDHLARSKSIAFENLSKLMLFWTEPKLARICSSY